MYISHAEVHFISSTEVVNVNCSHTDFPRSKHDEVVFVDGRIEGRSFGVERLDHGGQLLGDAGRDVVDGALDRRVGDVDAAFVGGVVDQRFPLLMSLKMEGTHGGSAVSIEQIFQCHHYKAT